MRSGSFPGASSINDYKENATILPTPILLLLPLLLWTHGGVTPLMKTLQGAPAGSSYRDNSSCATLSNYSLFRYCSSLSSPHTAQRLFSSTGDLGQLSTGRGAWRKLDIYDLYITVNPFFLIPSFSRFQHEPLFLPQKLSKQPHGLSPWQQQCVSFSHSREVDCVSFPKPSEMRENIDHRSLFPEDKQCGLMSSENQSWDALGRARLINESHPRCLGLVN